MSRIERERAVADAILLERAARVIQRRAGQPGDPMPQICESLHRMARALRNFAEAESDTVSA